MREPGLADQVQPRTIAGTTDETGIDLAVEDELKLPSDKQDERPVFWLVSWVLSQL